MNYSSLRPQMDKTLPYFSTLHEQKQMNLDSCYNPWGVNSPEKVSNFLEAMNVLFP